LGWIGTRSWKDEEEFRDHRNELREDIDDEVEEDWVQVWGG